ncbi:MAG: ribosome maturation factor RimM [Clostridiales Family XIII bacterium]|nr:ribosome maturation factor RimM [Clostridiales Family XIII bacterium]
MRDTELIEIGKIVGTVGIKGEIKLYHYSSERERIKDIRELYLHTENGFTKHEIQTMRYRGKTPVILMDGVRDRNAAEALVGTLVSVEKSALTPLDEESYYVSDLLGFVVVDATGQPIGEIVEVIDNPAHDILKIARNTGDKEDAVLLPFVDVFIVKIQTDERTVVIDPPNGLLEL